MIAPPERRRETRLGLRYPIRVLSAVAPRPAVGRTVTCNLSARGAYFSALAPTGLDVGRELTVVVTVPHRFDPAGPEVRLDLCGRARIVRIEEPDARKGYGEDGDPIVGVALAFAGPLAFSYSRSA